MDLHLEVRERVHKKIHIYYIQFINKRKFISFLTSNFSCEQPTFHIGMGSPPLPRKSHKEHNGAYCVYLQRRVVGEIFSIHTRRQNIVKS